MKRKNLKGLEPIYLIISNLYKGVTAKVSNILTLGSNVLTNWKNLIPFCLSESYVTISS